METRLRPGGRIGLKKHSVITLLYCATLDYDTLKSGHVTHSHNGELQKHLNFDKANQWWLEGKTWQTPIAFQWALRAADSRRWIICFQCFHGCRNYSDEVHASQNMLHLESMANLKAKSAVFLLCIRAHIFVFYKKYCNVFVTLVTVEKTLVYNWPICILHTGPCGTYS